MGKFHAYLTIGDDGLGVLTGSFPAIRCVVGTSRNGVYCRLGDWLLIRALCPEGLKEVLGYNPEKLKPIRVEMEIHRADMEEKKG